jgi:hypothetical protein
MQDIKEKYNTDAETMRKNDTAILEMRSSISQMKSSVESLSSRKDQIENRTHR